MRVSRVREAGCNPAVARVRVPGASLSACSSVGQSARFLNEIAPVRFRRADPGKVLMLWRDPHGLLDERDAVGEWARRDVDEMEAEVAVGLLVDSLEDE